MGEWRCEHCQRLLGVVRPIGMHIENNRSAAYTVSFPVRAVCRCGAVNNLETPESPTTLRRATPEPLRPGNART